jgi:hypothetical protein
VLNFRSPAALAAITIALPCLVSTVIVSALGQQREASSQTPEKPQADAPAEVQPESNVAPEQTPAPLTKQSYTGTNQCFICHRPQTDTWSESKHAQAFAHLPEHYRMDASCHKCHVTAFGQPEGFVAGTEKDLLMVGCESCHGPGALHIDAARRFVLAEPGEEAKIEKQMRETIVKTPTDSVCIKCHVTQAHGRHPAYKGMPHDQLAHSALRPTVGAPAWHYPGYSIKTCASCHYDRYKEWTHERHAALTANLPPKYRTDQTCATCHTKADGAGRTLAGDGDPHHNRIGAACESCHGDGLEHVKFNVRLISGPPLSPQLEQAARLSIRKGKPTATCIQCHVGESHKQHPEFEKSR